MGAVCFHGGDLGLTVGLEFGRDVCRRGGGLFNEGAFQVLTHGLEDAS